MVQPLGIVTVATPGTPVQATVNQATPSNRVATQSIMFQALPANAGIVYVGLKGMVRATGVGVLAMIPKPANSLTGPFTSVSFAIPLAPAGLNAADFYVDVDTGNDGALVTILTQ